MKYIAVTMGSPEGIGSEIILKSWPEIRKAADYIPVFIGAPDVFTYYAQRYHLNIPFNIISEWDTGRVEPDKFNILNINVPDFEVIPGGMSIDGAKAAYEAILKAIDMVQAGKMSAIVTAPLSKDSLIQADIQYTGHTEILLVKTRTQKYSMTLHYDNLFFMHLTGHKPLREAFIYITPDNILDMILMGYKFGQSIGIESPRIGVAGLNPHAGENGLLGNEEINDILPAVSYAQSQNINVSGPYSPDTLFEAESRKKFDIIIALYHDQGHIPIKALGRDKAVQLTVGLPFVRTSPAHGTAFDIAGKGLARPDSFIEAYSLAIRLDSKRTNP
jgi:4-hydroxythreonine-4-phosphate dehydrogenase